MADMKDVLKDVGRRVISGFYTDFIAKNVATVGQPIDTEFSEINKEVGFRVTPTYNTQRWKKGDTLDLNEISPQVVKMKLDTVLRTGLKINNLDKKSLIPNVEQADIDAAVRSIIKEADLMLIEKMRLAYNYSTLSSTPVIKDVMNTIKALNGRGVPTDRGVLLDPATKVDIFSISEIHKANEAGANDKMSTGQIGRILGMDWYESNNCRMKGTPADSALAVNNKGTAYAAGATTIAFDAGSSSDLKAGDMVKFGEGTVYYTIQSVTWGVAGTSGSFVINPLTTADAALAVDDAVIGVKRPNDAFMASKQGIVFGNTALAPYYDDKITQAVVSTPYGACRIVYGGNISTMEENIIIEMLCGAEVMNSNFIQKIVDLS